MNQETAVAAATTVRVDGKKRSRSKRLSSISSEDFEDSEELVGSNPEQRNWKGITISLFVILAVIGLVVLSVIVMTPEITVLAVPNVTMSDIMSKRWQIKNAMWIDDKLIYQASNGTVIEMDSDFRQTQLIPRRILMDNRISDYRISADRKYALLVYKKKPIYTYSYTASYYVYDIHKRRKSHQLRHERDEALGYVQFGPVGNSLIYYYQGDIYYMENVKDVARNITFNGAAGIYQNGIPDWIYEEEIFKESAAIWWSKNGRYIAFASFNDSLVSDSTVTEFSNRGYPKPVSYKYPEAGGSNPIVKVHVYDVVGFQLVQTFESPPSDREMEILHCVTWVGDDAIVITWSDRYMRSSLTQQYSINSSQTQLPHSQNDDLQPGRWISKLEQPPLVDTKENIRFHILSKFHGGSGNFNHLAMVNDSKTSEHDRTTFLTEGKWEVTKLLKYDMDRKWVYYISNENSSGSRHIYRVNLHGNRECISCNLYRTVEYPSRNVSYLTKLRCNYFDASFGESVEWLYARCLGPRIPFGGILRLNRGVISDVITPIQPPHISLRNVILTNQSFHSVKAPDGHEIEIKVLLPASVHLGKRPVVFFKRGVGSQTVDYKFQIDFASYISKSIGAVAVFVDGRGSGMGGERLLRESVLDLGTPEVEDMKTVLRFLGKRYEGRVDLKRVAVVGDGGYGGYIASLAMTDENFKCGVARSPITNWNLYESFEAERVLGAPDERSHVYGNNDLRFKMLNEMSGSKLRIYHGIQDMKVNMQHSVLLKRDAMITDLPLDAITVVFHSSTRNQTPRFARILEAKILKSISNFLKNCVFENAEEKLKQLEVFEEKHMKNS